MTSKTSLTHLTPGEQQALLEFVQLVNKQFNGHVDSIILFGSKARGAGTQDSDLDVLVVVATDDWRTHKQIRYMAADICLKYNVNLSTRVWSTSHRRQVEELETQLYRNIRQDGIDLLGLEPSEIPSGAAS